MMKYTTFADRLNACLDKEKFPPKNKGRIQLLAEMVGLTHKGASKWVNGVGRPPAKKYADLAQKLNVNELWLRTGEGAMSCRNSQDSQKEQLHLLDVDVYDLNYFLSNTKRIIITLKCTLPYKSDFFGIKLDSEAMSPRFPKESIIIFDKAEIKDGDFVLVDYEEFPIPIFRQLFIIGQTMYLNAHNPKFERLILNDKSRIMGKLIQAILSFE